MRRKPTQPRRKKKKEKHRVYTESQHRLSHHHIRSLQDHCQCSDFSHNTVHPLRNEVARDAEREETSGDAPEPDQVALVLLAGHPDVHAPHAGDYVHGQHNGTEDCEFAEDVGGLLGALVHADVDLGEVVAVGAREEAVRGEVSCWFSFDVLDGSGDLLLVVTQVACHGDNVILNIAQVQTDL